jgi:4-diphosphocytidyl-2-C-methyl-D-erythritol kinase
VLALNELWELSLGTDELCSIAASLGQDVVFALLCQKNECHAAFAYGTGSSLEYLKGIRAHVLLSKPDIGVSTAEVYAAMDETEPEKRPDTEAMLSLMRRENALPEQITDSMANVMESYTLLAYPSVRETRDAMQEIAGGEKAVMSGSGPTVFLLSSDEKSLSEIAGRMKNINKETFLTKTVL